jgi:hypothetical protein
MMVVTYFVIATIAGIALGLRFKVFVLIPATLVMIAIVATGHQPRVVLALTALGTAVLLQTGYFVGGIVSAQLYRDSPSNVNSAHGAHEGRSGKTNNHKS